MHVCVGLCVKCVWVGTNAGSEMPTQKACMLSLKDDVSHIRETGTYGQINSNVKVGILLLFLS